MVVRDDGQFWGSVSGGCVEAAVVEAALTSLDAGRAQCLQFGPADGSPFQVGLSCGGHLEVYVEPCSETDMARDESVRLLRNRTAHVWVCRLSEEPYHEVRHLTQGDVNRPDLASDQTGRWFIEYRAPADRALVFGAGHIGRALVAFLRPLGFETVLIDPRASFLTAEGQDDGATFVGWPEDAFAKWGLDAQTYVAALSHDPKIDEPVVLAALQSDASYVGALGGAKTQAGRREALRSAGLTEEHIARLHGPIGLDIGAETAEEIALSIAAEMVHVRRAGSQ